MTRGRPDRYAETGKATGLDVDWRGITVVTIAVLGLLQFIQGIQAAIVAYPGGFWLFEQYLSDLGQTVNVKSSAIFRRSLVLLGLSLVPAFLSVKNLNGEPDQASRFLGVVSCLGLIGIGVTPYDRFYALHIAALLLWICPMTALAIVRIPMSWQSGRIGRLSVLVTLALSVSVAAYGLLAKTGSAPFAQKIVIFASLAWIAELIRQMVLMAVVVVRSAIDRRARSVDRYLERLEAKGLFRGHPVDPHAAARERNKFRRTD